MMMRPVGCGGRRKTSVNRVVKNKKNKIKKKKKQSDLGELESGLIKSMGRLELHDELEGWELDAVSGNLCLVKKVETIEEEEGLDWIGLIDCLGFGEKEGGELGLGFYWLNFDDLPAEAADECPGHEQVLFAWDEIFPAMEELGDEELQGTFMACADKWRENGDDDGSQPFFADDDL